MEHGIVKFFRKGQNFGFITYGQAKTDTFFHGGDLGGFEVDRGQEVTFDISCTKRGDRAVSVRPVVDDSAPT